MTMRPLAAAYLAALAISLAACQDGTLSGASTRHLTPVPPQTLSLMAQKGMSQSDPILIRAYKKEAEMEVWKRGGDGRYALLKTFPICRWSGQLGPKTKQGDRQAPEGFYTVTPGQMNPNSSYYLSFDTGYPNALDRAKGASGNYIMVHGNCSSAGCFAMTDASMAEIYALARDSFAGGQRAFQFQSYPFRMNSTNFAKYRNDPNVAFWRNLKEGSDHFEALREEPRVGVCGTRYVFGGADAAAGSCNPKVETLVAEKRERDNREIAELVAKGTPATRVVYEDGSQNPVFRQQGATAFASLGTTEALPYDPKEFSRHHLGEVSRPETLAAGGREIEVDAKGQPVVKGQPMMMASAEPPIPTRAAAAAQPKKVEPRINGFAKQEPAPEPAKPAAPARIMVADAEGDPAAYKKLLGNLFGGSPAPATPAADAATVPVVASAEPAKAQRAVPPAKAIAATTAKPTVKPAPEAAKIEPRKGSSGSEVSKPTGRSAAVAQTGAVRN
jgi:murein L,D-transpeptidase YafK